MEDILPCDCPICLNSWILAKSGWIACWLDHRSIIFLFLSSFFDFFPKKVQAHGQKNFIEDYI